MNRYSKKLSVWMLTLAILLLFPLHAFALEESEIFYANDAANVLTEETEYYICDENYRLYDQCMGAEVVVVTVDFLDGKNAEEFSYEVFNDWALGDRDENNGVLILLSPGEEKYWIMSGSGLQNELSAGVLDEICYTYMETEFDSENYDVAALNTFKAVVERIDAKYGISDAEAEAYWNDAGSTEDIYNEEVYYEDGYTGNYDHNGMAVAAGIAIIVRLVFLIFIVLLIVSLMSSFRRITTHRPIGMPPPRTRRVFWGMGPSYRVYPRPRSPRQPQPPRTGGSMFGGTGRSTSGRRSTGGGMSRGGGFGSSSFGGSRSSFGGSRSSGGRMGGGGGRSRGGGGGRR